MTRAPVVTTLLILTVVTLSLAACGNSDTPAAVVEIPPIEHSMETNTPAPTVSVPTFTPTRLLPAAPSTPTPRPASPTPSPTPTPHIYVVQEFDTLLGIAIEFDTTVEVLVAANDVSEDDFLQVGQKLIIPSALKVDTTAAAAEKAASTSEQVDPSSPNSSATSSTPVSIVSDESAPLNPPPTAYRLPSAGNTANELPSTGAATEAVSQPAAPPPAPGGPPPPNISRPANVNPLTGLPVADPAALQRRPLMVRIGNDPGARPQAGLNSADIVYEEITEWWVTRFTAIFLAETPGTIAPVRSARLINVQLVPQYQGALAHSGGSDPVRWEISQAPIVNLDEFYNPLPYFYRPNQGWQTRLALDGEAARDYMAAKGTEAAVPLQGFLFSDAVQGGEPGEDIYVPYPRATSFTEWHYDAASSKYLRWVDGSPLYDFNGGQIAASNVIIYFAEHQATDIVEDSNGATSIRIIVNGKGPAWFFRDGKLNRGFWETDGTRTPYFAYDDGRPYSLKPGNTWVEVVPTYFTIGLNSPNEASSR